MFWSVKIWNWCHHPHSLSSSINSLSWRFRSKRHSKLSLRKFPALLPSVAELPSSHFSLYQANFRFVSSCSILPLSFWFSLMFLFLWSHQQWTLLLFLLRDLIEPWSSEHWRWAWWRSWKMTSFKPANRTGFEIQGVSRIALWCWYSSDLQNYSRHIDNAGLRGQGQNGTA